ncbi:MAG: DUF3604 domain-containing protein, partial [Halioglobus sp.]|nr:DUF3604 domain-containing protein [Halioglobus sp.]
MSPLTRRFLHLLAVALLLVTGTATAAPCDDRTPVRRAYFGDIHIHTGWSLDAYTRFGASAAPDDAYAFARGASIALPPFDAQGNSSRALQLTRPLDFAAVTDHAENLDQVRICSSDAPGSDALSCSMGNLLS